MARLCLFWHMHQPFYGDPVSGESPSSIVLFRTLWNYRPMALLAERFPEMRMAVNVTPVLAAQMRAIAAGSARGGFADSLLREPSPAELRCWAAEFPPRALAAAPKLAALRAPGDGAFAPAVLRDLNVLLHLACWDDRCAPPEVGELRARGGSFSAADAASLAALERQAVAATLELYARMDRRGQIELTASPFYHPILPLLCDTEAARGTGGGAPPAARFRRPGDARRQVALAAASHEETFGRRPRGMWPSEGAVSGEALSIMADEGIRWAATDETVLFSSTGSGDRRLLYRPRLVDDRITVFFRDRMLSDLIGFEYRKWHDERTAAEDFVRRIGGIGRADPDATVTVVLDGENAWEWYPEHGASFLARMYEMMPADPAVAPALPGDVAAADPGAPLARIAPGTWMGSFENWIGRPAANRAWELLREAADAVEAARGAVPAETLGRAADLLLLAESSDWFWWYSLPADPEVHARFDALFRNAASAVHRALGRPVPEPLRRPLAREGTPRPPVVSPAIDGRVSNFIEWRDAAAVDPRDLWATFRPSAPPVSRLMYGYDGERFFLRLDFAGPFPGRVDLETGAGATVRMEGRRGERGSAIWACGAIFEAAVARAVLDPDATGRCSFRVAVPLPDGTPETLPPAGYFTLEMAPDTDWFA